PSKELRKSLLQMYKLILRFQLYAIRYFDPDRKIARTFTGLNPVKAEDIKNRLAAIEKAKQKADSDVALVDAEVTKVGIDNLEEGQAGQKEQLEAIKQTLKALSGETVSAVNEQRALMSEFDQRQEERNEVFVDLWREPLDEMKEKLENERIERQKQNLYNVRRWLSRAEPETDYAEAKGKRHMKLGEWLIKHRKFKEWYQSDSSSLLWLHGFAGSGKTGLVCRVVDHLRQLIADAESTEGFGRLALFYCSSDKPNTGREDTSRDDPAEALRSFVSQIATSQQGWTVASILQEKYETFGPSSDQRRTLDEAECVEILVSLGRQVPVTLVLDAFDELDKHRSPHLLQILGSIVHECPENFKIFISTRSFPAIEDNLRGDQSIEVTAENNGGDVETFIKQTVEAAIADGSLLKGRVSDDLKSDIERILTKRAQNMFLYASLLLTQLCDKNRLDDEDSIRMKLEQLPKDITEAYSQIMVEVHDDKHNSERSCRIAQETFKWLLYAQEPLQHQTLLEAISQPDRNVDAEELLHACRTLVVGGKTTFEFAHYSVREHISRTAGYSASQCHIVATKGCLRILNTMFEANTMHYDLSPEQKDFGQYALLHWPLHYENIMHADLVEHRSDINGVLRTFLLQGRSKNNKYKTWFTLAEEK
ncbi:MAG: hypothetical protein Q9174_006785, partial [Haloplaca sp. 1 TL-2023]